MHFRGTAGLVAIIAAIAWGAAHAQTPVSLSIHGPSTLHEATSAEFRAVVTWSDGSRSSATASWSASWASANPAAIFIGPSGSLVTLTTGDVAANAQLNVSATFSGPTGPLGASKPVTVLDASSFPAVSHTLTQRWNLLGNSIGAPLNMVSAFGDPIQPVAGITDAIHSVWKWDAVNARWAVFAPKLTPVQLAAYAASNGFSVLQVVHPGEGYWVNASQLVTLPARSGGPVSLSTGSIVSGWNLVSTGQAMTPVDLYTSVSESLPLPTNLQQSLWAWNAATQQWLFYAPSLQASGGANAVKNYAGANGYLDFATLGQQLGHGVGFWINTGRPGTNSNLAPLGQAKAMFSELRTTVRAYTNDIRDGFLDAQSTRFKNDISGKVTPDLTWTLQYGDLLSRATRLFENVRAGSSSNYGVQPGEAVGTVRAVIMHFVGSEAYTCVSNDMTGTQVLPGLLTTTTCTWEDFNFDAYSYTFPSRTKNIQRASVTAGATTNDFNYGASKLQVLETWNGTFYQFVSSTQLGATQTGAYNRTYVGATTNISTFSFAGDLPPRDPAADRDTVNLSAARVVQNLATNLYRYNISGSVASKTAGGTPMVTLTLAGGSYYDIKEDANGNPLASALQSVHVVGRAETSASRFTGTIDLDAFQSDADGAEYLPASSVFEGTFEDLSAGGAGIFLTGRLSVTLNNLASYHSTQPDSTGNFLQFDSTFVGTIQAPSRPEMRLTWGSSRASESTYAINSNYTYGPVSVTGVGTLDTFNTDNSTLTLTNQDGITVAFQPHADAVVSKGATTLGVIPYGSTIVYFIDGYFESL